MKNELYKILGIDIAERDSQSVACTIDMETGEIRESSDEEVLSSWRVSRFLGKPGRIRFRRHSNKSRRHVRGP